MASYTIENAKSGRSSCKKCKEKIGKGDLRIGEHVENLDFTTTKWYHVSCFNIPRKLKSQGVTELSFVEDRLEDDSNEHVLSDKSTVSTIVTQISAKPKAANSKKNGGKNEVTNLVATLKRNSEILLKEEDNAEGDEPVTKKLKTNSSSLSSTERQMASVYLEYSCFKNDALKDILRWNRQTVGGNRSELLSRVIDGHVYGRLGRCTSCTKGKLKLSDDGASVSCSGYYDEDAAARISCFCKLELSKAPRLRPWYQSEPSAEEAEEMDNISEQREGTEIHKNVANSALSGAAEKLDWDLSSPAGMKKAAKDLLRICISEDNSIDLPDNENKARMEIGRLIIENRNKSATDILDLVIGKYGLKETNEKTAKAKSEARGSSCNVQANLPIMEVMLELGDLYTKESNYNAGNSYKKVAAAIKDMNFEITKDNAKGLCKGKTKVAGIGKSSADKIFEFLTTGKIDKLEEKKAAAA